jgi:L-2-hydroxyglutarate oxidase LhgO
MASKPTELDDMDRLRVIAERRVSDLEAALRELRDAANGVKYVAIKPQIYTDAGTKQHAANLIAALASADAVLGEDGSAMTSGVRGNAEGKAE